MNPVTIQTDLSGLSRDLGAMVGVLGSDCKELLKIESGQMAWRIAQQIGPKSSSSARKAVEKDVRARLTIKPVRENITSAHQGSGDIRWLYAGQNFVAGIPEENNQKKATGAEAMRLYYQQKSKAPTNAWSTVGKRGKQNVVISNRIRVSKLAFNEVVRAIRANIGQAKASFAFTTARTTAKRIPGWISRHFPTRAKGKALLNDSFLTGDKPFIEFGSRAKGVESNPRMVSAIQSGIRQTSKIIKNKMEKLLKGYTYDFNTGRVFRSKSETFDRN